MSEADSCDEFNKKEMEEWTKEMVMRHRLNLTKLLFRRDGHYTLRKFKRLFLRETKEQPGLYTVDPPSEECPDTEAMSLTEMDQEWDPREHESDISDADTDEGMLIDFRHLDAVFGTSLYPKFKELLEGFRLDASYIGENSNSEEIEVPAKRDPAAFEEYRQIMTEQLKLDNKSDEEFVSELFNEEERDELVAQIAEAEAKADKRAPLTEKHLYLKRHNKNLPGHTDSTSSDEMFQNEVDAMQTDVETHRSKIVDFI